MNEFDGRVALVTGGGRGIGRAAALLLASHGAAVAVIARSEHEITAVAKEIQASGGRGFSVTADIGSYDAVTSALLRVEQTLGSVDILVNNAGILTMGSVATSDPEAWVATIQTNLIGAYFCIRAVLPRMTAQGFGRIVNVSSFAGAGPNRPNGSAYAASKAGLDRLTRSLAAEIEGTGVTCNAFYPGDTDTPMQLQIRQSSVDILGEAELRFFQERHARGELYDPLIPARMILKLLMSQFNGAIINIDDLPNKNL